MAQPTKTPIEPGVIARLVAGFRYGLTGAAPTDWFGPMEPLDPALPMEQAQQAGVAGRQFDYRVGYNVDLRPRSGESIGFPQLRALADNCDLLRLVIETRKDQLCGLPWVIKPRKKGAERDARCDAAEALLRMPDGEHAWQDWLRMLLEDLFVLDAPTVYVRRTLGGDLFALEPIDGATIKRVIDATGRTPATGTAYQQILKGMPAVDYTRDELIYKPRNVRTHKVYGMSPVEQIINTINIALSRQLMTLNYFSEGTVPDALAGVPADWTVPQIKEFQDYWDLMLQDDMASRRKLKFVPGEISKNFHETKAPPLKDMFDEWLARIICYCFSIEPTPFVAQVNRAVAETSREQSISEGMAPLRQWTKALIDGVLAKHMAAADLEFAFEDEEVIDAKTRAEVAQIYVAAKVLHPDEVRDDMGRPALTPEQKADLSPPPPLALGVPGGHEGKPPKPGEAEGNEQQEAPAKKPAPAEA